MKLCSVEFCERQHAARGYCDAHYRQVGRHGLPARVLGYFKGWKEGRDAKHYLRCWLNGRSLQVHRVVWEEWNGPVPKGHCVHHVNGDKYDNTLENLELLPTVEHHKLHYKLRGVTREGLFPKSD
jgi:hypothetical protein